MGEIRYISSTMPIVQCSMRFIPSIRKIFIAAVEAGLKVARRQNTLSRWVGKFQNFQLLILGCGCRVEIEYGLDMLTAGTCQGHELRKLTRTKRSTARRDFSTAVIPHRSLDRQDLSSLDTSLTSGCRKS